MAYSCPLHNWWSDYSPCPSCVTTITTSTVELHTERHVSKLSCKRVKGIRDIAMRFKDDDDIVVKTLVGYIIELTK